MLGPIDYIVVGFKGNNFDGSVLTELSEAVGNGVIRVIDLLFIIKDADGVIGAAEVSEQTEELSEWADSFELDEGMQLLTEEDVEKIGATMENDTAAGVLVIEHLWAKGLKKALLDAGGSLLAEGRIHPDTVDAAVEDLNQVNA